MSGQIAVIVVLVLIVLIVGVSWRLKAINYQGTRITLMLLIIVLFSSLLAQIPGNGLGEKAQRNVDIIFLVDTTYSMNARDGRDGSSRLDNVREDINKITASVGGSVGIVNVGSSPYVYLPLTDNQTDVKLAVDTLITPGAYDNRPGSKFAKGLDAAANYVSESLRLNPGRKKIIVFMSDGERRGDEDTDTAIKAGIEKLKSNTASSLVIGYGKPTMTELPVVDFDSETGSIKQYDYSINNPSTGGTAGSKRDDAFLGQVAQQLGGNFILADNKQQIEAEIMNDISDTLVRESGSMMETNKQANLLYIVPVMVGLVLLVLTELVGLRIPLLSEKMENKQL